MGREGFGHFSSKKEDVDSIERSSRVAEARGDIDSDSLVLESPVEGHLLLVLLLRVMD